MRLTLFAVVSCALLAYAALRLEVRTAITDFLPHDETAERLALARELASAPQSRVLVLTLSAKDDAAHRTAAHAMAEALGKSSELTWVRSGLPDSQQALFYALYFPARVGLLELPAGEGPVPDAWIRERVEGLKTRLASPLGMLERRVAPEDPLGAFGAVLREFGKDRGRLELVDGQLVTEDGRWSVIFAATRAPAFDAAAQARVVELIDRTFAEQKRAEPSLVLEWSGVNRFALAGERSVRGDIERISTLSLVGIFLLYLVVFRSAREPLLVLLPIGFGCLLAVAACQAVFGFVHGLSLAFGSSIIGVAEDYSTHYFTHRRSTAASEDNESLMVRLWPGMLMGGVTTIVGILALLFSGFPGLAQMAVFGAVGVFGALVCTRYVLPSLSRKGPLTTRSLLAPLGERLVRALGARPIHGAWLVLPAVLAIVLGVPTLRFEDGMGALRTPTPELDAENQRVQTRLGRGAGGRVIVAVGRDDEEALRHAERAREVLVRAAKQGLVRAPSSVTTLVPSKHAQVATRARLAGDPSFVPRLEAALSAAGFAPTAFAPFVDELQRRDLIVLTPETLLRSPLADVIAPFRAELARGVAYLTPVNTERSHELEALLHGLDGIYYVDQEALFADAYARFRKRAVELLGAGLLLVLATLWLRYRSVRVSLVGMIPAVLGAGAALGVEGALGMPVTVMHVIAVLLVLSMGVDYGIYALESRHSLAEGVTTLGGVLLASLTTVLSFGLLGLSANPALAGIGLTVALGMVFTVLASPVVLAFGGGGEAP